MDPFFPEENLIDIRDIAHSLAHMPRFAGHTKTFYSVAQHCLRCAELAPNEIKLEMLLHDAAEAYLMDMPKPIKHRFPDYNYAEKKIEEVVERKFLLDFYSNKKEIKIVDTAVLYEEIEQLMNHGFPYEIQNWYFESRFHEFEKVETAFLEKFKILFSQRFDLISKKLH